MAFTHMYYLHQPCPLSYMRYILHTEHSDEKNCFRIQEERLEGMAGQFRRAWQSYIKKKYFYTKMKGLYHQELVIW